MTLAVFFPSLMGFGILVSGALLVGDLVNKALPRSARRREYRVAAGAYGALVTVASTAGRQVPRPHFLVRTLRARATYGLAALALGGVAVAGWSAPMAAYNDVRGVFHESPWMLGLAIGIAIGFALMALVAVALAAAYRRSPQWLLWLVRSTPVGRIQVPPDISRQSGLLIYGGDE